MELTVTYVVSQIFTIIMYVLLALTYFSKNRKNVLILNFLAIIANAVAYIFLKAYTGLAMGIVALVRNIIFLIDENKNGKRDEITKMDIAILVVLYVITIISAIFTFDGFLSLLSVLATMIYTYSVWQKKSNIYKFLGIPVGICWISYNIYIKSIFGIILETILFTCSTIGYILEIKKSKKEEKQS